MKSLAAAVALAAVGVLSQELGAPLAVLVTLAGSAGVGGLVMSYLTLVENRRQKALERERDREQDDAKARIDILNLGQASLAAALARADTEIERCHAEIDALRIRLDGTEERERVCQERIRELESRL